MRQLRQRRGGAQALEFALTLPVLLLLVSGIVDYGWFFVRQFQVEDAIREGARLGVTMKLDEDPVAIATARTERLLGSVGTGRGAVAGSIIGVPGEMTLHMYVEVEAEALFGMLPSPKVHKSSLEMFLENQPDDEELDREVAASLASASPPPRSFTASSYYALGADE